MENGGTLINLKSHHAFVHSEGMGIFQGLELMINTGTGLQSLNWGDYNPSHTYSAVVEGQGTQIGFYIYDSYYGDNSGALSVAISRNSVPEPTTMFMLGIGLLGIVGLKRRMRNA